jgi:hypothetical protein
VGRFYLYHFFRWWWGRWADKWCIIEWGKKQLSHTSTHNNVTNSMELSTTREATR